MIFNSFQFIWLFPIIFALYYTVMDIAKRVNLNASRLGNYLLIAISYGLYMQWNAKYALVLFGVTAITYISALLLNSFSSGGGQNNHYYHRLYTRHFTIDCL